ncbi:CRISPR-associated helicase Cas3' [Synechococcus sp. ATX 2A4]|nr:CRISPR-associated helicase Cas3' [Synechococcus sp. ATX 2A4]
MSAEGPGGYPLLPHLLDVAAVAEALLPVVPCPVPLPCSSAWVSALAGLHDFGKASPGFQRKLGLTAVGNYVLEANQRECQQRHDMCTVFLLRNTLKRRGLDHRRTNWLALAVGAHHGQPFPEGQITEAEWVISPSWEQAHEALFEEVLNGTGAEGLPSLPTDKKHRAAFLQWLMGLTTTADWLGSSEGVCRSERLSEWSGDSRLWFERSRLVAEEALLKAGLHPAVSSPPVSGAEAVQVALGPAHRPRPLQQEMASLMDSLPAEPCLIVIEAPMGEGKTEAALSSSLGSRGLYLAMPTQATSNALFTRLAAFLERQKGQGASKLLALAHGSGGPEAANLRLREIGLGTSDGHAGAGWWFRGSKRSLLCADGIGTVDQGLIGVLSTRHGFVRLYGLSGRTVIFDEVHAYDTYTGGLIERLIAWLQVLGCRVVVMSATLPASKREALLKAWSGSVALPPQENSYPRISWAVPDAVHSVSFAASRRQRVELHSIPSSTQAVAQQAMAWAREGARVLVVVNKVARAQELYRQLEEVPCTLFHARFPMDQRLEIERRVLGLFGPDGSATAGHVLVATQVAEQSLDIDCDVLITDPAPVDLVLQREGRIHRHDRARPEGFEQPLVYVADLDEQLPSEELTSFVYDQWDVLRSFAWLQANRVLQLPEDIDRPVQDVYGSWEPQGSAALLKALAEALKTHQADQQAMEDLARQARLAMPDEWSVVPNAPFSNDDDAESGVLRFGTRLGEDSQSVVPVYPADLADLQGRATVLAQQVMRISNKRLIQAVRQAPLPEGWRSLPGLAAHLPLRLDEAGRVLGCPVEAWLDADLGLVVASSG